MKLICFAIFLFSVVLAFAQPSLISNEMAPAGSSFNYKGLATFAAIDTNLQGGNQTWDFSTLIPDANPISTRTVFDPSQTIYAGVFPNANYGIIFLPNTEYDFYTLTNSKMELAGKIVPPSTNTVYSDPETQYTFPFELGINNLDSSLITGNASSGIFYFSCIGWGTIILPNITYTNAIMRHVVISRSPGISSNIYEWIDSNNGMTVFSYTTASPPSAIESAFYLYNISSGIDINLFLFKPVYANPFHSTLNIKWKNITGSIFSYELINSFGKIIAAGFTDSGELIDLNIELKNEMNGLYFLTLRELNNSKYCRTIKLIKQ